MARNFYAVLLPLFLPGGCLGKGCSRKGVLVTDGRQGRERVSSGPSNGLFLSITKGNGLISPFSHGRCQILLFDGFTCGLGTAGSHSATLSAMTSLPARTRLSLWVPRRPAGSSSCYRMNNWGTLLSLRPIRDQSSCNLMLLHSDQLAGKTWGQREQVWAWLCFWRKTELDLDEGRRRRRG